MPNPGHHDDGSLQPSSQLSVMSRPPTPVSACPLTRLEVRDGAQTKFYEAGQFVGGMTLTLDCQRSEDSGRDSLMLLVHCALREMVHPSLL